VSQKRKVTLYFNSAMLSETQKEALRQDRSISWIIQAAWKIARDEVRRMPNALAQNGGDGTTPAPLTGQSARPSVRSDA
jgi:uncharacterized small protein (TIGR04563 family)